MVDIARPESVKRKKKQMRIVYGAAGLVAIALITLAVARLKPAAPSVERATVWIDTVKRGPMTRQVRGSGTLIPEDIRWIPATTQGRVERILLRPGAEVKPDTVILEMSNPDLQQSVKDAQLAFQSAEAAYLNKKADLQSQYLNQQADAATIEANYSQAKLDLEANQELQKDGLVSSLTLNLKKTQASDQANRLRIAQQRLKMTEEGLKSQLAPQEADVNQRRAAYELSMRKLDDLRVKAGMTGVLQLVSVERGAQVSPGTNLVRVADPTNLKAEVRIAETQTKDLRLGQFAEIDTRNGIVQGKVARIDPASSNGTVGVDVILDGALPPGARPDLSVDGTIRIEKLDNVVFVGRPAFGQDEGTVSMFKLLPTGEAVRTNVKLGRSSVNTIEIKEGLNPGDQVILSDMSNYDQFDRIQLKG
ncbi:MAG: efflux RND transporter periplasmic adaptor subunit, partial [Vicinamibacterales bacterium]